MNNKLHWRFTIEINFIATNSTAHNLGFAKMANEEVQKMFTSLLHNSHPLLMVQIKTREMFKKIHEIGTKKQLRNTFWRTLTSTLNHLSLSKGDIYKNKF